MAIDKPLLYSKVQEMILQKSSEISADIPNLLYLISQTMFNDPIQNCIMKSSASEWNDLPPTKSLFHAGINKGLPIGNLTSQLFANIYLNDFDHFMKKNLDLKYYGRYVDDIVVVHPDHAYLKTVIVATRKYLKTKLMLQLHPKKIYLQHFLKGVKFLGAVIMPHRIYIANRTKGNFYNAIRNQNEIARNHKPTSEDRIKFICSMNSYLGIMKHYKSYKLRKNMIFKLLSCWWWNHVCLTGGIAKFSLKHK
jgi:hypothetical protein